MSIKETKKLTKPDGTVIFYRNGKIHNTEGPAIINPDGSEEYYINGMHHTKNSFKKSKKDSIGLPWYKSGVAKSRF
jgi:antitoxin component YwqK of YwqJK toxin-antitoxin module